MSRLPLLLVLILPTSVHAADPTYLDFIKKQGADLRAKDKPPTTLEESKKRNEDSGMFESPLSHAPPRNTRAPLEPS